MSEFEEEAVVELTYRARYEFGHYLVSRILGFRPGAVTLAKPLLTSTGGTAELDLMLPLKTFPDVISYCERRIEVLFAGVLAEALENGVVDNERAIRYAETSGANDFTKAHEHLNLLRNCLHERSPSAEANLEIQQISDRLWQEACILVTAEGELIQQLAGELVRKGAIPLLSSTFSAAELLSHPLLIKRFH